MPVPNITQKGSEVVMANKKVFIIPPVDAFQKYLKTKKGSLQVAVYVEKLFPFKTVQMMQGYYSCILSLRSNLKLVGIYTDDNSISNNKNDFRKLMNLCENKRIDMVICNSLELLSEWTRLLNEIKIPIYVLKDNLIIDNEVI